MRLPRKFQYQLEEDIQTTLSDVRYVQQEAVEKQGRGRGKSTRKLSQCLRLQKFESGDAVKDCDIRWKGSLE